MKKTMLIPFLLLLMAGTGWVYLSSPTRQVEYSYSVKGLGLDGGSIEPIRFALISDIHLRETVRKEITAENETREIVERFIGRMNNHVRPDFIVQLGDLSDGLPAYCDGEVLDFKHAWPAFCEVGDDLIIDRLRRAQAYTEDKTDIPWFDVIGNHEYASGYRIDNSVIEGKDFSAIYRAINPGWSRLQDTWYYRDIGGYRFIFLNTAYPYPGRSHLVPEKQLQWLERVLQSDGKPCFVFMHVPVSDGAGIAYDVAINQEKVVELLAAANSFVLGFFGHSHHSDKWDGLRRQTDHAGNLYFHIPAPHQWLGDSSSYPWGIVDIEPGEDEITVSVGAGVRRSEVLEFAWYLRERLVKIWTRQPAKFPE